jgi:hypothetical protein
MPIEEEGEHEEENIDGNRGVILPCSTLFGLL